MRFSTSTRTKPPVVWLVHSLNITAWFLQTRHHIGYELAAAAECLTIMALISCRLTPFTRSISLPTLNKTWVGKPVMDYCKRMMQMTLSPPHHQDWFHTHNQRGQQLKTFPCSVAISWSLGLEILQGAHQVAENITSSFEMKIKLESPVEWDLLFWPDWLRCRYTFLVYQVAERNKS